VPFGLIQGRHRGKDPLTLARIHVTKLAFALSYLWIAFSFLPSSSGKDVRWFAWSVVGLGVVVHLALSPMVIRKMVIAGEEAALLVTFQTSMFIGIGFAVSVALLAGVGVLVTDTQWLYPMGLAFALAGLWRIAPSQRVFAHCDELLLAQGKTIRMSEAWRRAVTEPPETTG
jgi:hypothetical protein